MSARCTVHPTEDLLTCPECVIRGEQAWEARDERLGDLDPYDGTEN